MTVQLQLGRGRAADVLAPGERRLGSNRSSPSPPTAAYVKGFRMPASHCARGCTEAGVRKASKEETARGVCAGGSVGLWGFKARFCATWPLSDGTAGLNG